MRCPVCNAENNEGNACRRCRADLSILVDLERHRSRLLHKATERSAIHDWSEVIRLADQAHSLRNDSDSQRMLSIGYLMQRDFDSAWRCCRQVGNAPLAE